MDRREALRKLGAGGTLAAGASIVMSSTDVAYAASGPPPNATIETQSILGSVWTVRLAVDPTACTETAPRVWSYSVVSLTGGKSGTFPGPNGGQTFAVNKTNNGGNPRSWEPGDSLSFSVTVTWDCGQATYGPTTLAV